MENKKMTKREYFGVLSQIVENSGVANATEMLDFIAHEVELLNKKASKSSESKTQKENVAIKENLLKELANIENAVTITEFQEKSEYAKGFSNQKISALFKQMVESGDLVKTTDKKKSYFSVAR